MRERPNILFIFTDQQRADTLACYGNEFVTAPNLNYLANQSFVFENAYVSSPICTPSRSTIMTGLWPHTSGCTKNNVALDPAVSTIADMLPDDYLTAYFGKWHLGDEVIRQHGFDEWISIEDHYRKHYSSSEYLSIFSDYHHFLIENGLNPDLDMNGTPVFSRPLAAALPEDLTKATFLSDRSHDFILEHKDRPFALYVNFLEPHLPYNGPFNDLHDPNLIPTSPAFLKNPPDNAGYMHRLRSQAAHLGFGMDQQPIGPFDEDYWRALIARYWGNVTLVDRAVGRILQSISDAGIADHTIVVFSSEHGDQLGDHGVIGKAVLYEQSIKVPLLVRVPWLGQEQIKLCGNYSHIDTVPTLLDLVGAPIPNSLQGESRMPVLQGDSTLDDNDVFIDWTGFAVEPMSDFPELDRVQNTPHRTMITADRWKFTLGQGIHGELYDLNSDPYEQTNLFDDSNQRHRIQDMEAGLKNWQSQTGDQVVLSGGP